MNDNNDIDVSMNAGAVKVYSEDSVDDFPVLKAFQQYIDEEQAKARRRIVGICVFFSFLLTIVIAVFVILLVFANTRNQALSDRLVEYAMNGRNRDEPVYKESVVVHSQDNTVLKSLSNKLEEIQSALAAEHARTEKAAQEAAKRADDERKIVQSEEAKEIARLKALLAAEKEKTSSEREKKRQADLEEYRRKHYPELYSKKASQDVKLDSRTETQREADAADREIESILKDIKPVDYFDDDEKRPDNSPTSEKIGAKLTSPENNDGNLPIETKDAKPPLDVKDDVGNTWEIPLE